MRLPNRNNLIVGIWGALILLVLIRVESVPAQTETDSPLIFGDFQSTLAYLEGEKEIRDYTSFSVQQLNVMFQKELSPKWTAFVNLESTWRLEVGIASRSLAPMYVRIMRLLRAPNKWNQPLVKPYVQGVHREMTETLQPTGPHSSLGY